LQWLLYGANFGAHHGFACIGRLANNVRFGLRFGKSPINFPMYKSRFESRDEVEQPFAAQGVAANKCDATEV